jgi:protein SCO1/2
MLTGSVDEITKVAKKYRVYFSAPPEAADSGEAYLVDHSLFTYLIDRNGDVADILGRDLDVDGVVSKVLRLAEREAKADASADHDKTPRQTQLDASGTPSPALVNQGR